VRRELDILTDRRKLDSVSIIGGEPTLHPQLCEIVRMVKARDISVEIFSNGLLLEPALLADLRKAGADMMFLHIDAHQNRSDLGKNGTTERLRSLREEITQKVAATGMSVGLAITAYADAASEIGEAVQFVLTSPHTDYLLVTLYRDTSAIQQISGDIDSGMKGIPAASSASYADDSLTNKEIYARLKETFGITPFAYIGSNVDDNDPRWLSYMAGTVVSTDASNQDHSESYWKAMKASVAEKLFLSLYKRFKGRYPFYLEHAPGRFRVQLIANALTGGYFRQNLALLFKSLKKGSDLRTKRLLFQNPAYLADDGTVVHCAHCPDAIVHHSQLVPVCIADRL
jgi:hypothetical protein